MFTNSKSVRMFVLVLVFVLVSIFGSACSSGDLSDGGAYQACGDITSCVKTSPAVYVDSPLVETLNDANVILKDALK